MTKASQRNLIFNNYSPGYAYPCKVLVTYMFTSSRPPKGMAGYLDWIMDGGISELIIKERFNGQLCQSLLISISKRIKSSMNLLIGAGDIPKVNLKTIEELGRYTCGVLNGLKISHFGLYPHDLFLPHLDKISIMSKLIEGFYSSLTNDVIIGLLSNNREQKEDMERWLEQLGDYENHYLVRHP